MAVIYHDILNIEKVGSKLPRIFITLAPGAAVTMGLFCQVTNLAITRNLWPN
jgi:hypothetical protein